MTSAILDNLNYYIIAIGAILFISVYASKITERIGVPLLLIFLGFGMLLGEEGLGGIKFSNAITAQAVGTVALIFILYSGGLETYWNDIKSVIFRGVILATLGVIITAFVMAGFIYFILDFSFLESLLLGAIISSTDAAAVFMILRSQKIALKNGLGSLLELESGANDPMAIFLTITIVQLISMPESSSFSSLLLHFLAQFSIGVALGIGFGYLFPKLCNKLEIAQSGLYPLISVAWMFLIFGISSVCYGNGYLSIYIAGILTNKVNFYNKENIRAFHNAIAWMMQIIVFLTLGLLVYPSALPAVALGAVVLALLLMFVARPVAVFACLAFSQYSTKERIFISWVGLRGAVPIILATYPYVYQLPAANMIFNMIFFMVLFSVLIQGMSVAFSARKLDLVE